MDKDFSEVPEIMMLKNAITGIPLRYGDALVGTADMMTDGSLRAYFSRREIPQQLYQLISEDVVDSLSIGPNLVRATPSPRELVEGFKFPVPPRMEETVKRVLAKDEERRRAGGIINLMKEKFVDKETSHTHPYDQNLRISRAIELVYQYVKDRLEKTDTHVTFDIDEVYVVWFNSTLGNWKALLSTTLPDGMYYEVTHDGEKKRAYIDAYKKFDNVVVLDNPEFPVQQPEQTDDLSQYKTIIPRIPAGEDDRFA